MSFRLFRREVPVLSLALDIGSGDDCIRKGFAGS